MTAFEQAQKYLGLTEVPGGENNPVIMEMLRLDQKWPTGDEVPWCSAFVNFVADQCGLERTKKLNARSWLLVGEHKIYATAQPGNVVVILTRGAGKQPGPEVIDAQGHVGILAGWKANGHALVLGGNQGNKVSIVAYPLDRVLGMRLLRPAKQVS